MICGISHVAFEVSDMAKSVHFYCDILGFTDAFDIEGKDGKPSFKYIKIRDGEFLELIYHGLNDGSTGSYSHLCLEVDDIHEIAQRLTKNGISLDSDVICSKNTGNFICWASDPDGNRIEFMQLDPNSPQKRA
jgi:Lactoylglutathione lyase and related lyases